MIFNRTFPPNGKVYKINNKILRRNKIKLTLSLLLNAAWLRGRRNNAPTEEEVLKSLGISMMKKENSKKVALENPFVRDGTEESEIPTKAEFPVYKEYEELGPTRKS